MGFSTPPLKKQTHKKQQQISPPGADAGILERGSYHKGVGVGFADFISFFI